MANALSIINAKGDEIAALPPDATVLDAAHLMNERSIGSIVVMSRNQLVGIFTERDVMRRVVSAGRDPATTPLDGVMTTAVACAKSSSPLDELRTVMRNQRIRHIPVVDDSGEVLGMVSIGDLNKAEHDVQEQTILFLEQYMSVT